MIRDNMELVKINMGKFQKYQSIGPGTNLLSEKPLQGSHDMKVLDKNVHVRFCIRVKTLPRHVST